MASLEVPAHGLRTVDVLLPTSEKAFKDLPARPSAEDATSGSSGDVVKAVDAGAKEQWADNFLMERAVEHVTSSKLQGRSGTIS